MKNRIISSEFIQFATWVSNNYKSLEHGEYMSKHRTYKLSYLEEIDDNVWSRVHRDYKLIQVSEAMLRNENMTSDFVFKMMIWSFFEMKNWNYIISDEESLDYYLKTNRSRKNILYGYANFFKHYPDMKILIKRYELIEKKIKTTNNE